jgi:hypothetical protein
LYISNSIAECNNKKLKQFVDGLSKYKINIFDENEINSIDSSCDKNQYKKEIEHIVRQSGYILICLSPQTIRCRKQITEIAAAWDFKKNIIYLVTNKEDFNDPSVRIMIQNTKCISCYDDFTINESIQYISNMILCSK